MTSDTMQTAGVLVTRGEGDDFELLWARRPAKAKPLGGFWSFVVGRVETVDAESPTDQPPTDMIESGVAACALRELLEETGLLVLRDGLVRSWRDDEPSPFSSWQEYRRDLEQDAAHFSSDLREAGLVLGTSRLAYMGEWTTPKWLPRSFHTAFFQLHLSKREANEIGLDDLPQYANHHEMARAEWVTPSTALARWRRGRAMLTTPLRLLIECLDQQRARVESPCLAPASHDLDGPIEILEDIALLPIPTATLPPATHTNIYVVGADELLVVDPGSSKQASLSPLFRDLDQRVLDGATVRAVLLTHHHADHIGGARAVAERYDAQIWAHRLTADALDTMSPDRRLRDGESIRLSTDDSDVIICLHTPGHAPGHMCLYHRKSESMIVGDLVASEGTIVIDPPDGHMGSYMESLERVLDLGPRRLLPAHGMPIADASAHLRYYVEHRMARERSVLEALRQSEGEMRPLDLVPYVYDDIPKHIWPLAARSLEAHLIHLVEEDYANTDGEAYWSNDWVQ